MLVVFENVTIAIDSLATPEDAYTEFCERMRGENVAYNTESATFTVIDGTTHTEVRTGDVEELWPSVD